MVQDEQDKNRNIFFRNACALPFVDHVILTGGGQPAEVQRVVKYDKAGWVEDLPSLITGRKNHGCSHYTDTSNNLVSQSLPSLLSSLSLLPLSRST